MNARRHLAVVTVAASLVLGAAVLALFALDAAAGSATIRDVELRQPDLGLQGDPFGLAGIAAASALATAIVVAAALVVTRWRSVFVVAGAWSVLVLAVLAAVLAPIAGPLREWHVVVEGPPIEVLDLLLGAACALGFVGSVVGRVVTPPRRDWVSVTPLRSRLLPPQTHQN